MADDAVSRYIAELTAQIARERLQLDRDIYQNIQLPTFADVTRPTAVSGLTGTLMNRPDLYGNLAGGITIDTLKYLTDARGIFLDDPRVPPELRGKNSLDRDKLEVLASTQQWNERKDVRDFGAIRSDADRTFTEAQRARLTEEQRTDETMRQQYLKEFGVDQPFIQGQPVPAWMAPHVDWARQMMMGNNGKLPTFNDLVAQLGRTGARPEDFNQRNPGQPFPGTLPTVVPGVLLDPAHGGTFDTVTGKAVDGNELRRIGAERVPAGMSLTGFDAQGRPQYQANPGNAMASHFAPQGGVVGPGGQMMSTAADAMGGGGVSGPSRVGGGGMVADPSVINGALGRGGVNFAGSGATAGNYGGVPMSQEQRDLLERGRATDISAQLQANQQNLENQWRTAQIAIDRARADAEIARTNGQTEIAASQEARANELEHRKQDLEEQIQRGRLDLDKGTQTGFVDGQETLSRVGLFGADASGRTTLDAAKVLGRFGDQATLEREQLYGGAAYVDSGETLAQRTQRDAAELAKKQFAAGLRGPADIVQYSRVVGGTPNGLRDVVGTALGRFRPASYGNYGAAPQYATADSFGQSQGSANEVAQAGAALSSPDQWSWQGVDKLAPVNRTMLTALSEGQGRRPEEIEAARNKVLGRFGAPTRGRLAYSPA